MKHIYLLPALALISCQSPGRAYVDMGPVENGLNFIGFSIVLAVLLVLIGGFIKRGGGK